MALSNEDIRAIRFAQENASKTFEQHLKEHHELVDTLIYLNETLKESNTQIKSWEKYSETLLLKFVFHGLTVHDILSGLTLSSKYYPNEISGSKIIDKASAKVVLRSQLETLLMYYYIYVNPKSDDEKELRYTAWVCASLMQRQNFLVRTEIGKNQKLKDKDEIEKLKLRMQSLSSFNLLSVKQQDKLLSEGNGKLFNNWSKILSETGFKENHAFSKMYYHWSTYSHAEGISAIQLSGQSLAYSSAKEDCILDLDYSKLMTCMLITQIVQHFKVIEIKFNTLPSQLQYNIKFYNTLANNANF
jgi:hypothetical protein